MNLSQGVFAHRELEANETWRAFAKRIEAMINEELISPHILRFVVRMHPETWAGISSSLLYGSRPEDAEIVCNIYADPELVVLTTSNHEGDVSCRD